MYIVKPLGWDNGVKVGDWAGKTMRKKSFGESGIGETVDWKENALIIWWLYIEVLYVWHPAEATTSGSLN